MRRTRGLSARLIVAIGLLAALHLAVFVTLLIALGSLRGADHDARDAARIAIAAGSVQTALAELEAAERDVAITGGTPPTLRVWSTSATRLRESTTTLAREAGPSMRPVIRRVRSYLVSSSIPLVTVAQQSTERARRAIAQGATEQRTAAIDAELAAIVTHERATRQERRDRASGLAKAAQIVGFVGIFATLLCAIGFLAYIRSAILTPLGRVADAARSLAAGDLRARVADRGGLGEVGELARTFDQMAASLEESRAALERQNAALAAQSAELVEAVRSAREAEHAKDDFFALVSHELRTPLTAIVGYVDLVLGNDGEALPEEHAHHLAIVERNAQRMLRLVGDLLFAAQVDAGSLLLEPDAIELPQLVLDAVELARPRAEQADIVLSAEVVEMEPSIGDRDRLAQVLDNLVSNALKFTPPGGRVAVRLSTQGPSARIEVEDTGVGIRSDDLPRLYDRFYRATNATVGAVPGLGLGLMIARAIVVGHGGTIAIRSEVGVGTTFTVDLPLHAVSDERHPAGERYPAGGR